LGTAKTLMLIRHEPLTSYEDLEVEHAVDTFNNKVYFLAAPPSPRPGETISQSLDVSGITFSE
jgi:hypothetical protein